MSKSLGLFSQLSLACRREPPPTPGIDPASERREPNNMTTAVNLLYYSKRPEQHGTELFCVVHVVAVVVDLVLHGFCNH